MTTPNNATPSNDIDPLSAMQADWQQTKPEKDGEFSDVPDGTYIAKVKETRLGTSERSGNYTFGIIFKIMGGKQANREKGKFVVLAMKDGTRKPENLPRLMADLETLGLKITQLPELRSRRDEIKDRVAVITLKMNRDQTFQNVYIERKASAEDVAKLGVPSSTADSKDGAAADHGAPPEGGKEEETPF